MSFVRLLEIGTKKASVSLHYVSPVGVCKTAMKLVFWCDDHGDKYQLEVEGVKIDVKLNADEESFAEWVTSSGDVLQIARSSRRLPETHPYIARFYEKRGTLYDVECFHLKQNDACNIKVKEE